MPTIKMPEQLTKADLSLIMRLIRSDAITRGYGSEYNYDNKSIWPRQLKNNLRVARKIRRLMAQSAASQRHPL